MGQNFALNMASHGFSVSVSNRSPEKVDATVARAKEEGDLPLRGFKDPKSFVDSLSKPRKIVLLVQAGAAVDATIATLSELLEVSLSYDTIALRPLVLIGARANVGRLCNSSNHPHAFGPSLLCLQ